jgi:uncharacterized membrane protein
MKRDDRTFPVGAGALLGLGLGGLFDGIVFHQILQWHHMFTSFGYTPDSVTNLQINTLADGLFHAFSYSCVVIGLTLLWNRARRTCLHSSGKILFGSTLLGFGVFNVVEGIVDHHLLGIHHVNETVPKEQWIYWDVGFIIWGSCMLFAGWWFTAARSRE